MRKQKLARMLSMGLAIALLASGCQKSEVQTKKEENLNAVRMADTIRDKYAEQEKYDYTEPVKNIERDEYIDVQLGFDIMETEYENYTDIVQVFQDSELTQSVGTHFEWNEEEKVISITPPRWSAGGISSDSLDKDTPGYDSTQTKLFDKGELKDWGNLPQYYMVRYVDSETGEKLEKPVVTVVTVKHEVEKAPQVSMRINEEGLPTFKWNKIKGADTYYVMTMDYTEEDGYTGTGWVQGVTEETQWTPEDATHLRTYTVSEAERSEAYNIEKYGEGTEAILKDSLYDTYYCVIAASEDGTSVISNTFNLADIAKKVPYTEEVKMSIEKEGSNYADGFAGMPSYKWVTMCDGTLVQKLINYQFDEAKEATETWAEYENEDMSDLKPVEVQIVRVPYTIDGTGFSGNVVVENYDPDTWEKDLEEIKRRQEQLANHGGTTELQMTEEGEEPEEEEPAESQDAGTDAYAITANNALSEYLAANMMAGNTRIALDDFPESSSGEYLSDAWMEAVYQNPMILGVKGASVSGDGKTLMVEYDTDAAAMSEKQKEIENVIKEVIAEIIKDDMTDLEKEFAINQYLCDTAEYDMSALENAEKNDFKTVDEEFNDSFTPYGVLVNKVGVCASYAGAFKLLAAEAGLECIVVTGDLEGTTPHAWNKVKVDGEWQIVDSTNNDNEILFNALLNLPDNAAEKVLIEDDRYVVDTQLASYQATTDKNEYYHIEQKYFDTDVIADSLTSELQNNKAVNLRTDYMLDDEKFMEIAQKVADESEGESLNGCYWMGVIYLTTE